MCTGKITPEGKRICVVHGLELVPRAELEAILASRGEKLEQPQFSSTTLFCPEGKGALSFAAVDEALSCLDRSMTLNRGNSPPDHI
jgi:hypothetical protein